MKKENISKVDISLNVETPGVKIAGKIIDLEDVSIQTENCELVETSDEECFASGEFYKYVSVSNGVKQVEKCKESDGERCDFFVQHTPSLIQGNYVDNNGCYIAIYDKNEKISLADIETKCTAPIYVTEAVEYNDYLMIDKNGGLKKWTSDSNGQKVARAKETTKKAGLIRVKFGVIG